jgi:SPP1 gp7 family putative phage head morphogenesis protein
MRAAAARIEHRLAAGPVSALAFQTRMTELLAQYLAGFDLLGRLHVLQQAKKKTGEEAKLSLPSLTVVSRSFTEVLGFESVAFEAAIERLRNLTPMTRAAFDNLVERYRMTAFTLSGVSDVRLIEQIQQALIDVLEQGGTQADFEAAVNALLSDANLEALTSEQLNTVFQTNVNKAYANGRRAQMTDPSVAAALPYWKYLTVGDSRVRATHAAMDGFVAKLDDPIWRRWYPPCGFNCRCTVVPILADEAPEEAAIPGDQRVSVQPDPGFGGFDA